MVERVISVENGVLLFGPDINSRLLLEMSGTMAAPRR